MQTGTVSEKLKGNDFFMAIGEVDLYSYTLFGDLVPSGKTVEIAVVIQADKDTGEVLKIATLQSTNPWAADGAYHLQNGVTVAHGATGVLADLRNGISVIDLQPYPRWLDAIQAMRDAIAKLSTYTTFASPSQSDLAVIAVTPLWPAWYRGNDWHGRHHPR